MGGRGEKEGPMRVDVVGKHFEVTDAIRVYAEGKTAKLSKFFDGLQQATVRISKVNHKADSEFEAELILDVEKHTDFVSHATGRDAYAAIDLVLEKGERQLREFKSRLKTDKH
jgi:putative sigma-54 modulation protein